MKPMPPLNGAELASILFSISFTAIYVYLYLTTKKPGWMAMAVFLGLLAICTTIKVAVT
jgi:hypothetical protein